MAQQVPVDRSAQTGTDVGDGTWELAPDLAYRRLAIVNVVFWGRPGAGDRSWGLIDTGLPDGGWANNLEQITGAAEARFGRDARPLAIVMTHGHADHTGALRSLAGQWEVPVYAHPLEHPYLNGTTAYPPPDPGVGGGLMSLLSPMFSPNPVNVAHWLRPLPEDGTVPGMPGWRWLHTPGHAPGHISLWREADRALIAGDAFITTAQESAYAVATQAPELHGPPMYYTPDWAAARESVRRLAALEPELVITGHGRAMRGPAMRAALHRLADNFDEVAVPEGGRYAHTAAQH